MTPGSRESVCPTCKDGFRSFVAMNAYDTKPKGYTYEHSLIRIETDAGVEGLAHQADTRTFVPPLTPERSSL